MNSLINRKNHDMFDEFFDNFFNFGNTLLSPFDSRMRTDVTESDTGYVLKADLPGVSKENIKISLNDGILTINAVSANTKEEKDTEGRVIRSERYSGNFSRGFYVGEGITEEDIKASYKDGVLTVSVPKKEEKVEDNTKYIVIE